MEAVLLGVSVVVAFTCWVRAEWAAPSAIRVTRCCALVAAGSMMVAYVFTMHARFLIWLGLLR